MALSFQTIALQGDQAKVYIHPTHITKIILATANDSLDNVSNVGSTPSDGSTGAQGQAGQGNP